MNPLCFLVLVAGIGLISGVPHSTPGSAAKGTPTRVGVDRPQVHGTLERLATWVDEVRAADRREAPGVQRLAGGLWLEVNRLKQAGLRVPQLEWRISELEENLRRGATAAGARRYLLNDLDYELDAVRRQLNRR